LYDGDAETRSGLPAAVTALKERIAAAAALLIASPEYNNGIPGPLKNAIDWLSRPVSDIPRIFGGRIVGVIGASPGRFGTLSAQQAWLPIFRTLGVVPYFGRLSRVSGQYGIRPGWKHRRRRDAGASRSYLGIWAVGAPRALRQLRPLRALQ
jgi:NAD(P)H-dependent FMN reductase